MTGKSTKSDNSNKRPGYSLSRRSLLTTSAVGGATFFSTGASGSTKSSASEPGEKEWSLRTGYVTNSSPTIVDNNIYFETYEDLRSVNSITGGENWKIGSCYGSSSPSVYEGTVYAGTADREGSLYAVDAESGNQEWVFKSSDSDNWDHSIWSSPTVVNDTVYVGNESGELYAIDAEEGYKKWVFSSDYNIISSPTVSDRYVYFGDAQSAPNEGNVYAVNADNGEEEWSIATGSGVNSSPTVSDGTVFIGSNDSNLYSIDKSSGKIKWSFQTGGKIWSSPTVANDTVYFGSTDSTLYAVDTVTGEQRWAFITQGDILSSPTIASDTIYVGGSGNDERLYAVDAKNGDEKWNSSLGGKAVEPATVHSIFSSPTVVDGVVYIGSRDYHLYAINTDHDKSSRGTRTQLNTLGHHSRSIDSQPTTTQTKTPSEEQTTETSGSRTFSYEPTEPTVDTAVTFSANGFPSDASAASYKWDFNSDGTPDAFGSTVKHIFDSGGAHTVTLIVELKSGETRSVRRTVFVNTPPEPDFTISPSPAVIDEPVAFDAQSSKDTTGSIESYEWDFNGDKKVDKSGRAVTHTFSKRGRPTVTLQVTDDQGAVASESRSITVQQAATFSLQLRDTSITSKKQTTVAITVNNLLGSEQLYTQLELDLPSGWDVTFVDAASAGGGTATEIFETQPGQTRTIRARISPNDTGEFSVSGSAFYFVGDRNPPRHTKQLKSGTLTVTDSDTEVTTSSSVSTPTDDQAGTDESTPMPGESTTGAPGFGLGAGATALGAGLGLLRSLDLLDSDHSEPDS